MQFNIKGRVYEHVFTASSQFVSIRLSCFLFEKDCNKTVVVFYQ